MILVGLHGLARSGKDTIAGYMKPFGYRRMAFADPLKAAAATLFCIPKEVAFSENKTQTIEGWDMPLRHILQQLGTEAMRGTFGDDFWIRRWRMEYDEIKEGTHVVITDVRFENEAQAIRNAGGVVIHVKRTAAGLQGVAAKHASEVPLPVQAGDITFYNTGSLSDCYETTNRICSNLFKEYFNG